MLFVTSVLPVAGGATASQRGPSSTEEVPVRSAAKLQAETVHGKRPRRTVVPRKRSFGSMFVKFVLPFMAVVLLLFAAKHVFDTRKVDVPVAPPIQPATTPFMNSV